MCISMLQILSTGRVYKISELADLLETNPRNIIEYKKELDEVANEFSGGIYIDTIPGRYGGYQLNGNAVIPSLHLSDKEKESLNAAAQYLSSRNDFMQKKEFQKAVGKIMSSIIAKDIELQNNAMVINRYPLAMRQEDLQYRYDILQTAIKNKKTVKFVYLNQKNEVKDRLFDPYELFMYNNAWFVIGWLYSEHRSDIFWYKLNRIREIEITNKRFTTWKYYQRSNYLDEFGFKSNGDWYHLEFIAYNIQASLVQERIYGKNQIVEPIDEKSTKVIVDMQNKDNILSFVLGFGRDIKVLEPEWLIDELKSISLEIYNTYEIKKGNDNNN